MSPLAIASVVFVCALGSAIAGMLITLPDRHRDQDSKDTVKLVMGLIATISALVLSLLIASANGLYNAQRSELQSLAANVILLDKLLESYGPETRETREMLRNAVTASHERLWAPGGVQPMAANLVTGFLNKIQSLSPTTDAQRNIQGRIVQVGETLVQTRLLMFEQLGDEVSLPVLTVLVGWICMLFLGFGLFTRLHLTVAIAVISGAASVSGAIFLILELSEPFGGLLRLSDAPLQHVLTQLGR
ncbi:MAG: hypothetical protein KIS73_10645 [Enhydrobacter sp.]|nr:hypothetical protein [Enhydrobacter sp.]